MGEETNKLTMVFGVLARKLHYHKKKRYRELTGNTDKKNLIDTMFKYTWVLTLVYMATAKMIS